ncbi:MAG: hypothetical protein JRG91_15595, partial [Deltaproteobacteria bacterium]|nr:hypothetical protein [Deltaproteobacteria bacterium]
MRSLLACLACLLAACAHEPAAELVAPYEEGSTLPGGYKVGAIERTDEGAIVVRLEGDPAADVLFFRREDDAPAFTRTPHCNVVFDSSLPSGSPTPQALGLAVQALADAARSGDGMCRD